MSDAADMLGSNLGPPPEVKAPATGKTTKAAKGMPERTWILLEDNDDIPPTGLYIGHNGTGYLLVPGEVVAVPNFLLEILDHAVTSVAVTDPKTRRVVGHRERMRFPYRRVAAPEITE